MTNIVTQIRKEDTCPEVSITNTTVFPVEGSHVRAKFTEFAKVTISTPNSFSPTFSPSSPKNTLLPPSDSLVWSYPTCQVGVFQVDYVALPTPPEEVGVLNDGIFNNGDELYYDGKFYRALSNVFLPNVFGSNATWIATYIADGLMIEITESQISSKYKASIKFTHWCQLRECLLDKLQKLNCLIVKEPTRTDICELKLYDEVLQLNYIYYYVNNILGSYVDNPSMNYKINAFANYVNSVCCSCVDCKKENC